MKGFPIVTATICLLAGVMFSAEIKNALKDVPVIGDMLNKKA